MTAVPLMLDDALHVFKCRREESTFNTKSITNLLIEQPYCFDSRVQSNDDRVRLF